MVKEHCTYPSSDDKYEKKTLVLSLNSGVGAHGDKVYNLELQVPNDLDLPNFVNCRLFSMWHAIKVS